MLCKVYIMYTCVYVCEHVCVCMCGCMQTIDVLSDDHCAFSELCLQNQRCTIEKHNVTKICRYILFYGDGCYQHNYKSALCQIHIILWRWLLPAQLQECSVSDTYYSMEMAVTSTTTRVLCVRYILFYGDGCYQHNYKSALCQIHIILWRWLLPAQLQECSVSDTYYSMEMAVTSTTTRVLCVRYILFYGDGCYQHNYKSALCQIHIILWRWPLPAQLQECSVSDTYYSMEMAVTSTTTRVLCVRYILFYGEGCYQHKYKSALCQIHIILWRRLLPAQIQECSVSDTYYSMEMAVTSTTTRVLCVRYILFYGDRCYQHNYKSALCQLQGKTQMHANIENIGLYLEQ